MQITYEYIVDYDASIIELKSIVKMVGIGQNEENETQKTEKNE